LEILFPTAISGAFAYESPTGYISADSLIHGLAYWMKFGYDQEVMLSTDTISADTISTIEGWNMIGSITSPVPVSQIISLPGGVGTSDFFHYNGRYTISDTIQPGAGYWVKVAANCQLVLSSAVQSNVRTNKIHVIPDNELPPPAPSFDNDPSVSGKTNPTEFVLSQNYPNPFNPTTTIHFEIPEESYISLRVYNLLGQEVMKVLDEKREAGRYDVSIDGSTIASGVYFYRLVADNYIETKKLLLLR